MSDHAAYMREWRKRRRAAGLPSEMRSPEAVQRRLEASMLRRRGVPRPTPTQRPPTPAHIRKAWNAVAVAIRRGELVRADTCEACGASGAIEAAHYNYVELLRVRWLCRSCHRRWDAAEPKMAAGGTP